MVRKNGGVEVERQIGDLEGDVLAYQTHSGDAKEGSDKNDTTGASEKFKDMMSIRIGERAKYANRRIRDILYGGAVEDEEEKTMSTTTEPDYKELFTELYLKT